MYKVIEEFVDLKDKCHLYEVGDTYPRKGANVSDERIAELAGENNLRGKPVIKKVEAQKRKPANRSKKED